MKKEDQNIMLIGAGVVAAFLLGRASKQVKKKTFETQLPMQQMTSVPVPVPVPVPTPSRSQWDIFADTKRVDGVRWPKHWNKRHDVDWLHLTDKSIDLIRFLKSKGFVNNIPAGDFVSSAKSAPSYAWFYKQIGDGQWLAVEFYGSPWGDYNDDRVETIALYNGFMDRNYNWRPTPQGANILIFENGSYGASTDDFLVKPDGTIEDTIERLIPSQE